MPMLTPNEAAKRSSRSRRTIMRAIEAGEIEARRDNRNQWQIDEDALAQWARNEQTPTVAHPTPMVGVAVLDERIRGLEMLLDEMREDRDQWREQAQRLALSAPAPQRNGLWSWLFRAA